MALTPLEAALNRSTPGFDALVQSIQSTTDRIERNKEFAKQVQAQKDMAVFQADLQFEQRLKEIQKLRPITDKMDLALAEGQARIQVDAALDQARNMVPIQTDALESELGVRQPYDQDAEGRAVQNQLDIYEGKLKLDDQYADDEEGGIDFGFATQKEAYDFVFDREKNELDLMKQFYADALDDSFTQRAQPVYNLVDEEGDPVNQFAPVTLRLFNKETGSLENRQVSWDEYKSYLDVQKQRVGQVQRLQRVIENNKLTKDDIGNYAGETTVNKLIQKLNDNAYNLEDLELTIEEVRETTLAYADSEQQDRISQVNQAWSYLSGEFREPKFVDGDEERVETFKEIGERLKDSDDGISETEATHFNNILANYPNLQEDLPRNWRDLVPNWDFDPTEPGANYKNMFLTQEQALNKIHGRRSPDDVTNANRQTKGNNEYLNTIQNQKN